LQFLDAWCELFIPRAQLSQVWRPSAAEIAPADLFVSGSDTSLALWNDMARRIRITLPDGSYSLFFLMYGTPSKNKGPHIRITAGGNAYPSFYCQSTPAFSPAIPVRSGSGSITLQVQMDNDVADSEPGRDRNAFIRSIWARKEKGP
jgi:hypothetical protein